MKNKSLHNKAFFLCLLAGTALITSCKKNEGAATSVSNKTTGSALTTQEIVKIANAGFSPVGVTKVGNNYLIEGDIMLTPMALDRQVAIGDSISRHYKDAKTEQYRGTNIALAKEYSVRVLGGTANDLFLAATKIAIKRYNDVGLALKFKLVDSTDTKSKADITITGSALQDPEPGFTTLGQANGIGAANGAPADSINLNNTYYTSANGIKTNDFATVIAHEMGHCVGFRHTDYMDKNYSKNYSSYKDNTDTQAAYDALVASLNQQGIFGYLNIFGQLQKIALATKLGLYKPINEGDAGWGAIHIPGTPVGPDANSWMLAYANGDRPFTANDIIALKTLFPAAGPIKN